MATHRPSARRSRAISASTSSISTISTICNDIDGLAALITACDFVVTVSNTTAHLAGALGKETYVLVPFGQARMWYWFHDRADNPFYPDIKIRRQAKTHDWASLMAPLADEIGRRAGG